MCCQTQVERPRSRVHRVYFVHLSFCVPEVEFVEMGSCVLCRVCNAVRGERKRGVDSS